MTFISNLRARMARRARYRQTVYELRKLPLDIKLDLDIAGIEDRVARQAVYG
ncbi:hypothetical protein [Citreimonas salinaria]|uniref:DUF1127 domain-containing protein n=1 Tax=Citreimonas salinaria TaxID=321339 RepID=A0A1H3IH22_9RHOB|nr:hypothetical protein [Citreimonas salinaria]SDY27153.1 hypothetical protein SAMN05444340_10574 [Citreimonas salinaria]